MKIYLASFKAKEARGEINEIKSRLFSFHEIHNNIFGCRLVFEKYITKEQYEKARTIECFRASEARIIQ
jgi:hypothetical protein